MPVLRKRVASFCSISCRHTMQALSPGLQGLETQRAITSEPPKKRNRLDDEQFSVEDVLNELLQDGYSDAGQAGAQHADESEEVRRARQQHDAYAKLDRAQLGIRARIEVQRKALASLNAEIADAQSLDRMSASQDLITDLFTEIHHLRAGATESEIIVREITREIRNLDLAKKNIVSSITGVKRYQMLVMAFDQFTKQAKGKQYRASAQALSAVKELAEPFKKFTSIERIATLLKDIQEIQSEMREQVMRDFETAFGRGRDVTLQANAEGISAQRLNEACLVIDAIGPEARHALLEWYCSLSLKEYRRIFRPSEEAGQLDNLARRFAWLRRVLKQYDDETSRIFPAEWNVPGCLLGSFAAVTRDDLKSVLVRVASGLHVTRLLEALKDTTEFEADMVRRLGNSKQGKLNTFEQLAALSPITHGTSAAQNISSVFEAYLGIFVDAQDRSLADMIANWRSKPKSMLEGAALSAASQSKGEGRNSTEEGMSAPAALVLPSSAELFHFYRETMERCAQLSTKSTFLELCNVYKKWLKVYAEEVLGSYLSKNDRRGGEGGRPNHQELLQACTVLNTADYCAETIVQLEERLKETIDKDYKDRISLEAEKELFTTVISTAILSLLKELEYSVEPALNAMLRAPWRDASIVSSESNYVLDLVSGINRVADVVKTEIEHRKYFRSWCDKAVGLIVARFTQAVVRARPISPLGAEQILLDLQRLKACLLHLPKLTGEGSATASGGGALASYNRVVAKSLGRIDMMLQVIMVPENPAEGFVDHYLVLIPCASFGDFQKMLDLKGVRRTEQNNLLDLFLAKTSLLKDLSDTSFLSTIDMDFGGASGMQNTSSASGGRPGPVSSMSSMNIGSVTSGERGLGGLGLSLPSLVTTTPNSALAHNLKELLGSLPMLQSASHTGTGSEKGGYTSMNPASMLNRTASAGGSRVGTPSYDNHHHSGTTSYVSAGYTNSNAQSSSSNVGDSSLNQDKIAGQLRKFGRLFSHRGESS